MEEQSIVISENIDDVIFTKQQPRQSNRNLLTKIQNPNNPNIIIVNYMQIPCGQSHYK